MQLKLKFYQLTPCTSSIINFNKNNIAGHCFARFEILVFHLWRRHGTQKGYNVRTQPEFDKAQTQVLRWLKSCLQRVRDLRWWESVTMILVGLKAFCHSTNPIIIPIVIISYTGLLLTLFHLQKTHSTNSTLLKMQCFQQFFRKSDFLAWEYDFLTGDKSQSPGNKIEIQQWG